MSKKKRQKKIVKLRRHFKPNVGMLIFVVIAIYIGFTIVAYSKRDHVKFYEVEEGSIVKEHTYNGLILREETVVNAGASGYLNYYIPDGRKAAKGTNVYSIDETGRLNQYLSEHPEELNALSESNVTELRSMLANYSRSYTDEDFRALYDVNAGMRAQVLEYSSFNTMNSISEKLAEAGISFSSFAAEQSGIISYAIDGMENLTLSDITGVLFDRSQYARTITKTGEQIEAGTPAYKLITSDEWQIVFPMSDDDIREFSGKEELRISFPDKQISTVADFTEIPGNDGKSYGVLDLSRYLVQFTPERYVNFEIVTNDVSGLKIPEKSITTKDFYIIPIEYLHTDELEGEGFLKESVSETGTSSQFTSVALYNKDDEYCYIDVSESSALKAGDYVSNPKNPSDRYQIGPMKPLEGVYNINKGYAVFKRIEPLESSNNYCIIAKNTSYGLSVYDHIVLDAQTVEDGQLVYR